MDRRCYLGIDVGSISTSAVVVDGSGEVLCQVYVRGEGRPIASVQESLAMVSEHLPAGFRISGVSTTGSGRAVAGAVVGADIVKNEITAHARAAVHLHPEVRTILEIGGQDSKITILRGGVVVDFAMNTVCAAGTGSFLDSQARRLGIQIDELGEKAVISRSPVNIAGRCTVFAESDMIHKQQLGHAQTDILMGLCLAMVRNYLGNVCRGKPMRPPVVFQGGVSANMGIRRALRELLGSEVTVPRHNMVMGAFGAALIAAGAGMERTGFRGFEVAGRKITTAGFGCEDCPNNCEIVEIVDSGEIIGRSGGRCRKWSTCPSETGASRPAGLPSNGAAPPARPVLCSPCDAGKAGLT